MNDFLDNLSKAVNETAKKAMKVSGDVVELTKTSLNIKFDEIKRESFFKEIGKITYEAYKNSPNSVNNEIFDFCKCIDEIETDINSQKNKAAEIKNKKFCVDCGVQLPKNVKYCYSCGSEQPEIIEEEEECGCCGCECSTDSTETSESTGETKTEKTESECCSDDSCEDDCECDECKDENNENNENDENDDININNN